MNNALFILLTAFTSLAIGISICFISVYFLGVDYEISKYTGVSVAGFLYINIRFYKFNKFITVILPRAFFAYLFYLILFNLLQYISLIDRLEVIVIMVTLVIYNKIIIKIEDKKIKCEY